MTSRHREDCLPCRLQALGFTIEQAELVSEAIVAGIYAGWTERGMVTRNPSEEEGDRMLALANQTWTTMFGTLIPESAEVQAHRHRGH